MTTHELKCWPEHFSAVADGSKRVELRLDDRGYAVGDVLWLREYDPRTASIEYDKILTALPLADALERADVALEDDNLWHQAQERAYTGADVRARVTHLVRGHASLVDGYVAMSIEVTR